MPTSHQHLARPCFRLSAGTHFVKSAGTFRYDMTECLVCHAGYMRNDHELLAVACKSRSDQIRPYHISSSHTRLLRCLGPDEWADRAQRKKKRREKKEEKERERRRRVDRNTLCLRAPEAILPFMINIDVGSPLRLSSAPTSATILCCWYMNPRPCIGTHVFRDHSQPACISECGIAWQLVCAKLLLAILTDEGPSIYIFILCVNS